MNKSALIKFWDFYFNNLDTEALLPEHEHLKQK